MLILSFHRLYGHLDQSERYHRTQTYHHCCTRDSARLLYWMRLCADREPTVRPNLDQQSCSISESFLFSRIVFRALQGIGGAGAYALAILCIYEIAPRTKLPTYSAIMSCCLALACLIGPIVGGILAEVSAWRWVFFIKYVWQMHRGVLFRAPFTDRQWKKSVPLCAIAIVIVLVAMPKNFGLDQHKPSFRTRASYRSFANLDLVGSLLIIIGSFLIVTVFNETNLAFSWSSGASIALLVLTGISWIAFFAWEIYISDIPGKDPIFPKRWFFDRLGLGVLMFV